jgi:hypothetical protein
MPISINKFAMSECRAHLTYNIDKCLYILPKEATDCVTHVLTREMTSVRDGSRANARLIKHPPAGASKLRKKKNQEVLRVQHKTEKVGLWSRERASCRYSPPNHPDVLSSCSLHFHLYDGEWQPVGLVVSPTFA